MYRTLFVLPAMLIFALSACSSPSENSPSDPVGEVPGDQTFEVSAGTSIYSDRTGATFMLAFDLEAPAEDVRVSILGPDVWNDGETARRVFSSLEAGKTATWFNVIRNNEGERMDAVTGTYIVQASIEGETYRREVTINADNTLDKPIISEPELSPSTVSLSWNKVEQAASYLVTIDTADEGDFEKIYRYTQDTELEFDGVNLESGQSYKVGLTAITADFTSEQPEVPQGSFNASYTSYGFTAP